VITAVGMAEHVTIMARRSSSPGCMLFASAALATFVERHPTIKMLARVPAADQLSLIAEGFNQHVPKGAIYSRWASVFGEMVNLRMRVSFRRMRGSTSAALCRMNRRDAVHAPGVPVPQSVFGSAFEARLGVDAGSAGGTANTERIVSTEH
jgi:hypothetical protein